VRVTALALLLGLGLAGCSVEGPSLAGQPGLQWQVKRFFDGKATEVGGSCTYPRIQSITAVETLRETEDEVVMRIRYFWADENMARDDRTFPFNTTFSCRGFAERDFTFVRLDDGTLQVTDMTGARRNVRKNFNTGGS
jgi:hypothetical protein